MKILIFWVQYLKVVFTSTYFFKDFVHKDFVKDFVHIVESVTRTIYAWRIISHNKIVPNWNEAR